ncbi:substrate-binding periplasmic protein [Shewanella glacialimarina]|jgi:ABC-type amino acid transport substrate-binding protein|uniref:substrate-binding periplasmic protein n=1 Tax=Shewanella glacialimarina TaxID=2590884 RepID=UPI001CF89A0E|nr:transporter substrate-binding domain-containing protein [Shewanella glacialimarina]UCX04080.1 ABC transporter substrate-binding protein [Shewanella glacialimarina]
MHRQLLILLIFAVLSVQSAHSKPIVKVAGYQFAPYLNQSSDGLYTGLSIDVVKALNGIQSEVQFEFVATSIGNRYKAYKMDRYDMILFESPIWGWQDIEHEFVPLHINDGELFIALKDKAIEQQYFDSFSGKVLSLVRGYHYAFAQWQADPKALNNDYNIQFVRSNEASIVSILRGRANIAPVTWSYLQFYLAQYPEVKSQLLISNKWDQKYDHGVLLNPKAPISKQQLTKWISLLQEQNILPRLAANYGL